MSIHPRLDVCAIAALAVIGLEVAAPAAAATEPVSPRLDRLVVRPKSVGQLIAAGLTPSQAAARRAKAMRGLGQPIARIDQLDLSIVRPPAATDPIAYAMALAASGDFDDVRFDCRVSAVRGSATPDDPLYASQWHLAKIAAPVAWSITVGNPSVVVAVCDSGVDLDHPDLAPVLVPGYNAVDHVAQVSGGQVDGLTDHGTEVAGCIAAATDNGQGIAGLGWDLRLMPIRVSNQATDTANLADIVNGVVWAVDHGATVINVSFSGVETSFATEAGAYARAHGASVVWAAGNSSSSLGAVDPSNVLVVGATDQHDALASFSNFGAGIDLVAPGVGITTTKLGGYASPNGTSFAAPIVAGALALVRSANASLSPTAAEFAVLASTDDIGSPGEDNTFGSGRVNVGAAVAMAVDAMTTPLAPIAMPDVAWRFTGTGPSVVAALSNDLDLNGTSFELSSFDATSGRGGSVTEVGSDPPSLSYQAPTCLEGSDHFQYVITDPDGLAASGQVTVSSVRAPAFQPPVTVSAPGGGVTEGVEAADLDNDGDTDLVAVYGGVANDVVVFTRGPNGFALGGQFDITLDVQQLRVGDIAGSARPDLVAVDGPLGRLVVAPGLDTGGFGASVVTPISFPQAIVVAVTGDVGTSPLNINADGKPDLFVSTAGFPMGIKTMFGDGVGGFSAGPTVATPGPANAMELADMNGDGGPELIAAISGVGLVHVYAIGAGGQLTLLSSQGTGATIVDLAVADIDGDGDRDVVVQGSGVLGSLPGARVLLNAGNGQLGPAELLPPSGAFPFAVLVDDFDGDGDADLAEANLLGNSVGIHPGHPVGTGLGAPSAIAPIASLLNTTTGAAGLASLDDNSDGLRDIAVLVAGGGTAMVRIYRASTALPSEAIADLDHDGVIGAGDLAALLGAWGTGAADLDGDGVTAAGDLAILLSWWGANAC